jgi:hypothetical protein
LRNQKNQINNPASSNQSIYSYVIHSLEMTLNAKLSGKTISEEGNTLPAIAVIQVEPSDCLVNSYF